MEKLDTLTKELNLVNRRAKGEDIPLTLALIKEYLSPELYINLIASTIGPDPDWIFEWNLDPQAMPFTLSQMERELIRLGFTQKDHDPERLLKEIEAAWEELQNKL